MRGVTEGGGDSWNVSGVDGGGGVDAREEGMGMGATVANEGRMAGALSRSKYSKSSSVNASWCEGTDMAGGVGGGEKAGGRRAS